MIEKPKYTVITKIVGIFMIFIGVIGLVVLKDAEKVARSAFQAVYMSSILAGGICNLLDFGKGFFSILACFFYIISALSSVFIAFILLGGAIYFVVWITAATFSLMRYNSILKVKRSKNSRNENFATQSCTLASETNTLDYKLTRPTSGPKNYEIVIFRKSQLQSSAKTYTVFIDGTQAGKLRNGGTLSIRTNVGTHRLDFKGYFKMETSFDFTIPELQKRTNIFTRVSLKSGKIFAENIAAGKQEHRQAEKLDKPEIASPRPSTRTPSLAYIDRMEGHDFEQFTANLLRKLGYERVQVTPGSGDQGVDVIAVKDGKKYAIQCKRYNQKLGNKPVQEVHAGKTIYGCNVAVVMTNNYFTDGGKEAARALGVELWDRDVLRRMLVYAEHMEGRNAAE